MQQSSLTPLAYAILGLLHMEPRTGYALRKVFETTPMGHYSSSPGAIYPALKRLEKRGLASSHVDDTTRLRPKQVYALTDQGVDTLREWVSRPLSEDDVIHKSAELMLRFGFMGALVEDAVSRRFLEQMVEHIENYVQVLEQTLSMMPEVGPPHGRLALISGIENYRALARWAKNATEYFEPNS